MLESIPPEWLASITSSSILAALGSIFFIFYKAKIEKRVQFHFDEKLEETRNIFRKEEETFKDELRKRGEAIAALRTGALTRLEKRHLAIDERKLRAIENIWTSVVRQSKLKTVSKMTGAMKMDIAIEAASKGDSNALKLQKFASTLWPKLNS